VRSSHESFLDGRMYSIVGSCAVGTDDTETDTEPDTEPDTETDTEPDTETDTGVIVVDGVITNEICSGSGAVVLGTFDSWRWQ